MKYSIIDAHCDTLSKLLELNTSLHSNNLSVSSEKMMKNKSYIQFFASFIEKEYKDPFARAEDLINKFYTEINANSNILLIKSYDDVIQIINERKFGAMLTIEDARVLCNEIGNLIKLYKLGVRAITLAWNDNNEVTDGILSERGKGLSPFGLDVVKTMNDLKIIIDVSHISIQGFWDVLSSSNMPVMASHSNAYKVCPHVRNLNDEQIKELIKNEGIIGINFYPLFLNYTQTANVFDIIKHIDYILSLGGENSIGIGSDFDGIDFCCSDVCSADKLYIIFDEMLRIGYKEEIIEKISYKNFLSFLKKTL